MNSIDKYLEKHIIKAPDILSKAIRYSTIDGGKRLRPILCVAGFRACGGGGSHIMPIACAIELVHTFSLIHDDLPCMDNDDFRRGKPASHKVFGEDIAILAGCALLTMAFSWIASAKGLSNEKKISIIKELSNSIGQEGLVSGQALDLRMPKNKLSPSIIKSIYLKKTAALITCAVRSGAIAAGAGKTKLNALTEYGKNLGLAFQIMDDLRDLEQDSGKMISYPGLAGKEKAYNEAKKLIGKAINSLTPFGRNASLLEELAWKTQKL